MLLVRLHEHREDSTPHARLAHARKIEMPIAAARGQAGMVRGGQGIIVAVKDRNDGGLST